MWFHLPLPFHLEFFTNLGSRHLSKVAHLQNRKTQWGGPGHEGCERAGPGSRTPCKPPCGGRPLREGHREGLEISKKGSAMMWFMLWAAHSYTLPMPEAGRKLVGCDSDLGKRWRGCRIGAECPGLAIGWGTRMWKEADLLCWWAYVSKAFTEGHSR